MRLNGVNYVFVIMSSSNWLGRRKISPRQLGSVEGWASSQFGMSVYRCQLDSFKNPVYISTHGVVNDCVANSRVNYLVDTGKGYSKRGSCFITSVAQFKDGVWTSDSRRGIFNVDEKLTLYVMK